MGPGVLHDEPRTPAGMRERAAPSSRGWIPLRVVPAEDSPVQSSTLQNTRLSRQMNAEWSSRQRLEDASTRWFTMVSANLPSPEPIMCFHCQGSELAQGAVAMLLGKTSWLLSCRPQGCWDGEPTALRLDQFMEEDSPLWAVYSVLRQHYSFSWRKNK